MILKKSTVLIVDDDPDVLTAVKLLLKTEAQEVITEKNPENLNWLLQRHQVDLVLLDKKESIKLPKSAKGGGGATSILGDSEVMQDIFFKVGKIAPTDANILILGENGTGKDLMAKAIHERSLRADKPYVKVDVGALTDTLFESELFGHKKGAYTDARDDRAGRFEEAEGGTLFLDEIGNITLQQQAKLLTVLQNRQVTRLGTNRAV